MMALGLVLTTRKECQKVQKTAKVRRILKVWQTATVPDLALTIRRDCPKVQRKVKVALMVPKTKKGTRMALTKARGTLMVPPKQRDVPSL